jgi:hypothetical protein
MMIKLDKYPKWKLFYYFFVGVFLCGLVTGIGFSFFLRAYRPVTPDVENGFVISFKFVLPVVFISSWEQLLN